MARCRLWKYRTVAEDPDLVRLDPESEASLGLMVDVIAEEITARLAVGDADTGDPAWARRVAVLAADALLDRCRVRPRAEGEQRYLRQAR